MHEMRRTSERYFPYKNMKLNAETLVGYYQVDVDIDTILPRGRRDVVSV